MTHEIPTLIEQFLGQRRIALVGASRNRNAFSRKLLREFVRHGYDMVPVNPHVSEMDGVVCWPHMLAIQPPVEGALLLTSREATYHVLLDCYEAGIRRVWLYGISGPRDVSVGAMEFCATHGIDVVPGFCPFMFLPNPGFVHRFHRSVMRLVGTYPR